MKQPSDLAPYSQPSNNDNLDSAPPTDASLPTADARIHNATVLLRNFAHDAAQTAVSELRENLAAATRALATIEANTWSHIAAVLEDAEWPGASGPLSPEARLANAISLSHLDDDHDVAELNFDFHYALLSLAKANLMMARLEVLKEKTDVTEIVAPIEAELSSTLDGLLDSLPEIAVVVKNDDQQFAA